MRIMFGLVRSTTTTIKSLLSDVFKYTDSSSASNTSTCERLDFIIFGASGCMGRYTVLEAVKILKDYDWGIAGRNQHKLQIIMEEVEKRTSTDLVNVPIIVANVKDQHSINVMAESCKVLINCCGPYSTLAEPVIQACLRAGTHYVDLCCEPYFMEIMQYKYNEEACLKNVYIVTACGLQSLPYEMAVAYVDEHFNGTVNSVEIYADYWSTNSHMLKVVASLSSWYSIVQACANVKDIAELRRKLLPNKLPALEPKICFRGFLHRSEIVNGVCLQFPLIDKQVVERSQQFWMEHNDERPIQYTSYLVFSSYFRAIMFLLWAFIIFILAQMPSTRELLLKFPRIFSFGFFSNSCPEEEFLNRTAMNLTVNAVGWSRIIDKNKRLPSETNRTIRARLAGVNPLYGVACVCLLTSAVTICKERKQMPKKGGVLTPGAAFRHTSIIKALKKHERGLVFEIIGDKSKLK